MGSKKYYAVIDTETATIPELKAKMGDQAGLTCPLVYDLAVVVVDRFGTVFHKQQWIIAEIYSSPTLFETAYYAYKRPQYEDMIRRGLIKVETWSNAKYQLLGILERFNATACAYNAGFDFKKAFHSTNTYVRAIYKPNGSMEVHKIVEKLTTKVASTPRAKDTTKVAQFWLVDKWFDVIDIWNFACQTIFQKQSYRDMAVENGWYSPARNLKTNAEVAYRFITNQPQYIEEHTALEDSIIEAEILVYCLAKRGTVKIPYGIAVNPWQKVKKLPKEE